MKILKWKYVQAEINHGTEEEPDIEQILAERTANCADDEVYQTNLAIAQAEAYNGEVTVEEAPDPETPEPTAEESVWDELDNAYTEGYKEGVNNAYGG